MRKGKLKRGIAILMATITMSSSVIPYLPPDLLTAYAFNIGFQQSGQAGHPDIFGRVPGDLRSYALFCLNKGASAHSNYNYTKVDADVDYSTGTLEQKRLFWAYILTHGSANNDDSLEREFKTPLSGNTMIGKNVAWSGGKSNGGSDLIESYANDGFAQLDKVPEGAKSAKDILNTVMTYNTPDKAIGIASLQSGPGQISPEKLWNLAGLSSMEYFNKYCKITAEPVTYQGKKFNVVFDTSGVNISYKLVDDNGWGPIAGTGEKIPDIIMKVIYDPAIFKVISVTGKLEYFKCDVDGSQQLYRAIGTYTEENPAFYITSGAGGGGGSVGGGGGGGSLDGGEGIEVKIYQHDETFESNYQVDLTKKDYETGNELENATWQVLEAFPDQTKLAQDETDGNLVEENMREAPTTWEDWLIFEDDMKTDENGYISHADKRYYDFSHTYCNGHPEPEPPESTGDPEADADAEAEYEALMEEWQAAVDECEAQAEASGGTHHHWIVGGTEEPSEEESFEGSGAKAARDTAYDNFINLRYSYTFRETDARDGYIIHGQNGHPDDVPIEIITTAASEAEKDYEWTQASNEDIVVSGYARDYDSGSGNDEGDAAEAETYAGNSEDESVTVNPLSGRKMVRRTASHAATSSDAENEGKNLYLTEQYDLALGQKAVNALRQFIGLPEKYASEKDFRLNIVAEYEELDEEAEEDSSAEEEIQDEQDEISNSSATSSNAKRTTKVRRVKRNATSSVAEEETSEDEALSEESSGYTFSNAKINLLSSQAVTYAAEGAGSSVIDLASATMDSQPPVEPGPADRILHSWVVYDHRVPGQIHINKRDMELAAGETDAYDSYGDTQGDSTLEGAVYGLFAADDIYHPDTQRNADGTVKKGSGIVFDTNDLVAVATTDKNGDASFLAITEKPHSTYNYKSGQIENSGKEYPKNLYDMDGYRKEYDEEEIGRIYENMLQTNGDYWIGRPLILGNYYIKELNRSEGFELSITGKDMEVTNATEDNREDYGETEDSKSHPQGTAWITDKLSHAVTFPEANETYGKRENLLSVGVRSNHAVNGYDVVFDGIPHVTGVDFYFDNVKTDKVTVQVPVGGEWVDATEEPLYETAADNSVVKRDKDGNAIQNPDAVKDFPISNVGYGYEAKKLTGDQAEPADPTRYEDTFSASDNNFNYVKYEFESMLRAIGGQTPKDADSGSYSEPDFPVYDMEAPNGFGMPEYTIQIKNATTNKSVIDALLNYFVANKVYTYGSLQEIEKNGNTVTATVAVGMNPKKTTLYETDDSGNIIAGYLFKLNSVTGRYIMRKYTGDAMMAETIPGSTGKVKLTLRPDFTINEKTGLPENKLTFKPGTEYLTYKTGETIYDYFEQNASGEWVGHEPVRRRVYQTKYEEQEIAQDATTTSKVSVVASREAVADPIGSTYVYYDEELKQYVLHAGTKDVDLSGEKEASFTIALPNGSTTLTAEDIAKVGDNNVWGYTVGQSLKNSEYLVRIQGAGAGVHTSEDFDKDTSFIKNQRLIYNGNFDLLEDGNTNENPNGVQERIIGQEIKVTKTIDASSYNVSNSLSDEHEDWFTDLLGNVFGQNGKPGKIDNFRFKVYLKSNITRLYRDNDGNVTWQDRKGNTVDQLKQNENFPALVNKIYTKVLHRTDPLFKNTEDAVIANDSLYSYTDGLINENQNEGYTSILETVEQTVESNDTTRVVKSYNYDKFFDAIAVANNDKWDDQNQTYTSWKPIGNEVNRNENTVENAKASDKVRQFAIDWYLDDEVKKLVRDVQNGENEKEDADGSVDYHEELYDDALRAAIIKAENYLKPFFAYDLDRIYSVEWDSAKEGGSDKDKTTLSADTLLGENDNTSEGYYYGTSVMLPYGTYVVAEQQPRYNELNDFPNKNYQIDQPKEIILPSVYDSYEGSQASPEVLNSYYNYDADIAQPEMERKYKIRFNEEPVHVIKGRNAEGDFEVYKYGMELQNIRNGVTGTGNGDYFALTQDEYKPEKNYYNEQDDRTTGNVPYYLAEGLSGREKVSKYYRYSAVSEDAGTADDVQYPNGTPTEDNVPGFQYQDGVRTLKGILTAYDDKYAQMLVPWTIVPSENAEAEKTDAALKDTGESSYKGFDYTKFRNRFFAAKLRIEKLDSETHESILHDGAMFMIYKAQRDEKTGDVLFYEEDTTITGSEEFLKAMNAENTQPLERGRALGVGELYSGVVKAGTPICEETDKVSMPDNHGNDVGEFEAFSTINDVSMKNEDTDAAPNEYRRQTTGYLDTPQPLSAGAYVLLEVPPRGYVRTKPIAIEVYSDKVAYYKEGNHDERVLAALYEFTPDGATANLNKPQDKGTLAQIYVENTPIKLQIEKVKPNGDVTFKVGSRVEGSLTEIGGDPDLEYAYANGQYLGYGYEKGTLERLKAMKDAGEQVEIVYEDGQFAGYGYVTKTRETSDDANQYVAGAKMTLFDAIELTPSGDTEDHTFEGLQINRNNTGNILEMFVKKGYAGKKTEMVKETDADGKEVLTDYVVGYDDKGNPITKQGYTWKEGTVERPDTDILYYDLDSLSVTWTERIDNRNILFGWDKNHQKVAISQIESDKKNHDKSDREPSIYAFKGGQAVFEFVGGNFTKIKYNATSKILEGDFAKLSFVNQIRRWKMGEGTVVYHLDRNGNRDAMVDPYTGMAYVLEPVLDEKGNHIWDRVLVWPINIAKDEYGNIISRDKITTSRVATVGENLDGYNENVTIDPTNQNPDGQKITDAEKPGYSHQESGFINGSWESEGGEESHRETSLNTNKQGQNMNEDVLLNDNNGDFLKYMNPVYDEHGLVLYYQRSSETYDKGTNLYDRNGDFVRYKDSDNLEEYNKAAYALDEYETLYDGVSDQEAQTQDRLYHRKGESYILENTWMTSDKTPNDPFATQELAGQADLLKRLPAGTYIMEELAAPEGEGYTIALPTGITVEESAVIKSVEVVDDTTKIIIEKTDEPTEDTADVLDMSQTDKDGNYVKAGESRAEAVEYGYTQIPDAKIALYPAKYTVDLTKPEGYRLDKTSEDPFVFETTNSNVAAVEKLTASWTTGAAPIYLEGVPAGYYILEELAVPENQGFVKSEPVYVHVISDKEIQSFKMADDHTKVAIWKYKLENGDKVTLPGAEFGLYEALLNADGSVVMKDGVPQYDKTKKIDAFTSNDASDYTDSINLKDYPNTNGKNQISGFTSEFEKMYAEYGVSGKGFGWSVERTATRDNADSNVWLLENGSRVVVGDGTVTFPADMSREDREGFKAAYADMAGKKLKLKWVSNLTARVTDIQKIDAADAGGNAQKYPAVATVEISVTETGKTVLANVRYNGKEFDYSYKFDYTKLSVNKYANAWLTADGMRRYDYLPSGMKLVLVEEKAPTGFALSEPQVIEVKDITDVQLHDVVNEQNALLITKKSSETGKEFAGNKLALYRADENGELTKEDAYLVEEWTSGEDGTYTENDLINGLIPDGFKEGDLRPHYIYNLADGKYFLTEAKAQDYYRAFEPIAINYQGGELLKVVEAVNQPITGKLIVNKTDMDGGKLNGVVFELSAFDEAGKLVEGFPKQVTDSNGVVTVSGLPVGKAQADGAIVPYTYKLREITPPTGFALNNTVYSFQFEKGEEGYTKDPSVEFAVNEIDVKNEKTKFYIEKKDLTKLNDAGTDGAFIDGAVLAIYRVSSITDDGKYTYNQEDLFEQWTSSKKEGKHLLEGMVAGQSYVFVEKKAPKGYTLMKPVLLTISADGRSITEITNNMSIVKVEKVTGSINNPDTDSIAALTVKGRTIQKTEVAVLDSKGKEILRFAGADGEHVIGKADGLNDNEVYTFAEHTLYSDGSDVVTAKVTRRVRFGENGFVYRGRRAESLTVQVKDAEGNVLSEFTPTEEKTEQVIDNNLRPENPKVVVKNRNGEAGEPLTQGQPVINTITYYNPSPKEADITVEAVLGSGVSLLDPYSGTADGNVVRWTIENVAPYRQGSVSFASSVNEGASVAELSVVVETDGKTFETTKQVPVKQENMLTVYNELTGSGKEIHQSETSEFTVRLFDERGDELAGSYAYTGSKEGMLRSGDTITLSGNEFITIDPANFRNCTYEVTRADNGLEITGNDLKGVITEEGSGAWFTRSAADTSERQIFVKGGTYILTETTAYTDGEARISNQFSFTLNENASISAVGGYDKETKVSLSKTDFTTGEELPGNHMQIVDKDGNVVEEWVSGDKPHEITGLTPGDSYTLKETSPKDGYSYAEDITFTVNEDGTVDSVVMEDKPTHIQVSKKDITNDEELPGATLEIIDKDGNVVEKWVSTDKPHEIIGKLIADETYTLRETIAPDGFVIANEIQFTVSHDGSIDYVEMVDDTTKVRIHKNVFAETATPSTPSDADKGQALAGSTLQVLNEDKTPFLYHGEELIFTTGESFKLLEKTLVAGKTYWLHEVKPTPGYAFADDVKFTVSLDGRIDVVVMEDKPTDVILSKKAITGEDELPGNKMQLVDEDGNVIDEWTSGEKPHEIKGKLEADKEYHLVEVKPIDGYAYAEDVVFTVNHDGTPTYVEMRDDVTKVEILKVSKGTNRPLSGAEFELLDKNGIVVDKWVSTDEAHKIYGKLIAGETYTLRETKAPSGYKKMADVPVTVNLTSDVLTVTAENTKTPGDHGGGSDYTIRLRKIDENGNALAGASFKATGEYDGILSVTMENEGTAFAINLKRAQKVTISEISAPEGYDKLEGTYEIEIPSGGDAILLNGDEQFYQDSANSYVFYAVNKETPFETPEETPEQPSDESKKGKITAEFDKNLNGIGKFKLNYDGSVVDLTAKTGDDFPIGILLSVFIGSLLAALGAAFMYFKKKKGNGPKNDPPKGGASGSSALAAKLPMFLLLAALSLSVPGFNAEAAPKTSQEKTQKAVAEEDAQYREKTYLSDTNDPDKQKADFEQSIEVDGKIYVLDSVDYEVQSKKKLEDPTANIKVVTSAPFVDEESNHVPNGEMKEGEKTYYLKSYEVVETKLDARTEPVSDTITYNNIPVDSAIPEMAKLSVKDSVTGENVEVQVPLTDKEFTEPHWISGFEFPITVSNYDAGVFDLNGQEITLSEEAPLEGYEGELLNMIGVSAEDYRINAISWDGGSYTEGGVVYRKLKAVGEMRVTDCKATYSGVVNLPEVDAKAVQAVYSDRRPATASNADGNEAGSDDGSSYSYTMKATAKYVPNAEPLKQKTFLDRLIDFITNPVVIAVLLTLLFIVLVIWLVRKKKKKEGDKFLYISDDDEEDE